MIYRGRHDEGVVGGRLQVPRFQTEVRHVKVLGWNVTVDVAVEHKKLHKGSFHPDTQRRGGKGPLTRGGTTFRSADLVKCMRKKDIRRLRHFNSRNTIFEHFIE